jgi:hypothetical protein
MGVIGNCTAHVVGARKEALVNRYEEITLPHLLTIAVVVGIAVSLSSLIVCVGIFCFRRYARQERIRQRYAVIAATDKLYSGSGVAVTARGLDDPSAAAAAPYAAKTGPGIRPPVTDYMHVWQLPLPQPNLDGDDNDDDGVSGPFQSASTRCGVHMAMSQPPPPPLLPSMSSAAKSDCAYSIGSLDSSRYFVLDHNHGNAGGSHDNSRDSREP